MVEAKKSRNMTERGFLHKASGKVSADAFLATHKAWLETGELAEFTAPILRAVDEKELMPTPALHAITQVVFDYMMEKENTKAENALLNPKASAKPKPWIATIYNAKGEIQSRTKEDGTEEDLQKGFDTTSLADGWTDRRLFDGSSDWYGVVSHTTIINRHGDPLSTTIMRDDSIARILKQPKSAVCKVQSKTTSKLGFGVKAGNDRAVFSKG